MRQGIDIQAAVGRRPLETSTSSKNEEPAEDNQDDDKMDVENEQGARASTPKRDAEEQLGNSVSKKLKEDSGSTGTDTDTDSKFNNTTPESKENGNGDAMIKD
ncbi:hypothetical protein O1611_g6173 [Lasiodiplodia mahajangana]|uniref:Uncharacterized protein n=1 Tax=Lasiodiplodia mahajangana TaxID=1108764 RepID=A0ACC2JJ74_9PEZI|nr:hypothetical protein O1611_g6173 [Lasiodiplodia mahajangana]